MCMLKPAFYSANMLSLATKIVEGENKLADVADVVVVVVVFVVVVFVGVVVVFIIFLRC